MNASQIFSAMDDATASGVFQYLRNQERKIYSAALSSLCTHKKLRPVVVQKKPVLEQIDWMLKNVRQKSANEIAENVLQLWLLKGNSKLLVAFLDGLGITHDGEGAAEDIPETLDAGKLKATVDQLLSEYDPALVRVYLHTFQMQRKGGWREIAELIASTPALQYQTEPVKP
jgi:hypothetical protein